MHNADVNKTAGKRIGAAEWLSTAGVLMCLGCGGFYPTGQIKVITLEWIAVEMSDKRQAHCKHRQ